MEKDKEKNLDNLGQMALSLLSPSTKKLVHSSSFLSVRIHAGLRWQKRYFIELKVLHWITFFAC